MVTPVSAPTVTSIVITPSGAIPLGATITATVTYVHGTSQASAAQTLTGTVTDTATGQTGTLTQTFTVGGAAITDPTTVTVSDTGGRAWTKVTDTGTVAVFTAIA